MKVIHATVFVYILQCCYCIKKVYGADQRDEVGNARRPLGGGGKFAADQAYSASANHLGHDSQFIGEGPHERVAGPWQHHQVSTPVAPCYLYGSGTHDLSSAHGHGCGGGARQPLDGHQAYSAYANTEHVSRFGGEGRQVQPFGPWTQLTLDPCHVLPHGAVDPHRAPQLNGQAVGPCLLSTSSVESAATRYSGSVYGTVYGAVDPRLSQASFQKSRTPLLLHQTGTVCPQMNIDLEEILREFSKQKVAGEKKSDYTTRLKESVNIIVREVFPDATLVPYGSSEYGLFIPGGISDIDFILTWPGPDSTPKGTAQELLKKLESYLKTKFEDVNYVPSRHFPLVSFTLDGTKIEILIGKPDHTGNMATKQIQRVFKTLRPKKIRELNILLKLFLNNNKLNGLGSLTSFMLVQMTRFFIEVYVKETPEIGDLLVQFLKMFGTSSPFIRSSTPGSEFYGMGFSPVNGQAYFESRRISSREHLFIQNPLVSKFENAARNVGQIQILNIQSAFEKLYNQLTRIYGDCDMKDKKKTLRATFAFPCLDGDAACVVSTNEDTKHDTVSRALVGEAQRRNPLSSIHNIPGSKDIKPRNPTRSKDEATAVVVVVEAAAKQEIKSRKPARSKAYAAAKATDAEEVASKVAVAEKAAAVKPKAKPKSKPKSKKKEKQKKKKNKKAAKAEAQKKEDEEEWLNRQVEAASRAREQLARQQNAKIAQLAREKNAKSLFPLRGARFEYEIKRDIEDQKIIDTMVKEKYAKIPMEFAVITFFFSDAVDVFMSGLKQQRDVFVKGSKREKRQRYIPDRAKDFSFDKKVTSKDLKLFLVHEIGEKVVKFLPKVKEDMDEELSQKGMSDADARRLCNKFIEYVIQNISDAEEITGKKPMLQKTLNLHGESDLFLNRDIKANILNSFDVIANVLQQNMHTEPNMRTMKSSSLPHVWLRQMKRPEVAVRLKGNQQYMHSRIDPAIFIFHFLKLQKKSIFHQVFEVPDQDRDPKDQIIQFSAPIYLHFYRQRREQTMMEGLPLESFIDLLQVLGDTPARGAVQTTPVRLEPEPLPPQEAARLQILRGASKSTVTTASSNEIPEAVSVPDGESSTEK